VETITGREQRKKGIALTLALAAGLALASCGGDDEDPATASPGTGGMTVSVASIDGVGDVLVAADGTALYSAEQEADGRIQCTGPCASDWIPLLTVRGGEPSGSPEVEGDLGTTKRPDGGTQVTYEGMPLYTFVQDGPGEAAGDGLADSFAGEDFTWHVVAVDGEAGAPEQTEPDDAAGGGAYSY
jgi:predicted lipoprotein with Yx(FWY)xxD motif